MAALDGDRDVPEVDARSEGSVGSNAGGRLADFCRAAGEPELTELTPIPCETFVRYGMWFTQQ
ncbi:hypothetical protein ACWFR5_29065 [Streptomyces sp. NPDC055092]